MSVTWDRCTKTASVIWPEDRDRSYTANILEEVISYLDRTLRVREGSILLDCGWGFGGIALSLKNHWRLAEVYGLELDPHAAEVARNRGVLVTCMDMSRAQWPFPDQFFDVVTSFGVLDYMPTFDHVLVEMRRVLKSQGIMVVSLPNLASWHNRISLLLGYQPRDVEISDKYLCGVHPYYHRRGDAPSGHIHTCTAHAFKDLAEYHGFQTLGIYGIENAGWARNRMARTGLKALMCCLPHSLRKRFLYIGEKTDRKPAEPRIGFWHRVRQRVEQHGSEPSKRTGAGERDREGSGFAAL